LRQHVDRIEKVHRAAFELKKDKNSRTAKNIEDMLRSLEFWKTQMDNYEKQFVTDEF